MHDRWVRGVVQNSDETFTGKATGYVGGSGNLTIMSSKGATCSGDFVYVTRRQGEGVFQCSDGRSGPFTFASTGSSGVGNGSLGGEIFTFTFGGPVKNAPTTIDEPSAEKGSRQGANARATRR
jgi:hypothetical protein